MSGTIGEELELVTTDQPSGNLIGFLDAQLSAFNVEETGYRDFKKLAVSSRSPDDEIVAGISGYTWGFVCKIQLLWVASELRGAGMGGRLLRAAEAEALVRGCSKAVLSTHSFQAPDFYRRNGYQETGLCSENPRGFSTFYFEKVLAPERRRVDDGR